MFLLLRRLFDRPRVGDVSHFYAIDFGRGIAALSILVWHYQHFFFRTAGDAGPSIPTDAQPLYHVLAPLYESGFLAVQFFWVISGFVFAAVYLAKRASTRDFVVNRIARLYPLHLLTLLVIALLQFTSQSEVGHQQIYGSNDIFHFLLNLIFAARWGLEVEQSFNGPIWSVSVEVLVYVLFWATLPFLYRRGILGPILLAVAGWWIHFRYLLGADEDIALCVLDFFIGSTVYLVFDILGRRPWTMLLVALMLVPAGLWLMLTHPRGGEYFGRPALMIGLLLILCAAEAAGHGHRFRVLRWVGDNTYGTYLWHVPLQIATLIILDRFVGSRDVALRPWFLCAFIVVVVVTSRVSFIYFERPAREWIRHRGRPREVAS